MRASDMAWWMCIGTTESVVENKGLDSALVTGCARIHGRQRGRGVTPGGSIRDIDAYEEGVYRSPHLCRRRRRSALSTGLRPSMTQPDECLGLALRARGSLAPAWKWRWSHRRAPRREGSEGRRAECAPRKGARGASSSDHPFQHILAEQERGRGTGLDRAPAGPRALMQYSLSASDPPRPGKSLSAAKSAREPMMRCRAGEGKGE
jgi:hypothetical protein